MCLPAWLLALPYLLSVIISPCHLLSSMPFAPTARSLLSCRCREVESTRVEASFSLLFVLLTFPICFPCLSLVLSLGPSLLLHCVDANQVFTLRSSAKSGELLHSNYQPLHLPLIYFRLQRSVCHVHVISAPRHLPTACYHFSSHLSTQIPS